MRLSVFGVRLWFVMMAATLLPDLARAAPESVHTLVMIVNFANAPAPPMLSYQDGTSQAVPLDIPNAEAVFFTNPTSTAARYAEMSQNDLTLTGEVIEVSLPQSIGFVEFHQWKAAADAAAVAQGYTLSSFDRFGYLLSAGFSGQTATGGAGADWFWASGPPGLAVSERVFNHELGHTLGLRHASEIQADGSVTEVGDWSDFMGSGDAVHTNAINKLDKGWLGGNRHLAHPLDSASAYWVHALASTQDALQVVTVDRHGAHPDLGVPVDLYLSFRAPINFDQQLPVAYDPYGKPIRSTVHVHYGRKDGKLNRYFERVLEVGDVYTAGNTTIEVLGVTPTVGIIDVSQAPYYPNPPLVGVAPVVTNQVMANTPVDYDVSVTNTDSPSVPFPTFYENSYTTPGPGWTVGWDMYPKPILVDQGATELITGFRVTSPPGTAPGIYDIALTLTNETGSAGPVSTVANITYEVLPPVDTTPPPPPSGLYGTVYPGTGNDYIVLQWSEPPDVSDIAVYQPYRNGVALPTPASRQPIYVDFYYDGTETNAYVVRSVDAASNESEPSDVLVEGVPDSVAPQALTDVMGVDGTEQVGLAWSPGVDDVWVAAYEIHRNGVLYATTWDTSFTDLSPLKGPIVYSVFAVDGSGNISPASNSFITAPGVPALPLAGSAALALGLALAGTRRLRQRG